MARLQILQLPEGASDDRPPFALIVDQVQDAQALGLDPQAGTAYERIVASTTFASLAEQLGARAVLVFERETIDIPANEIPAGTHDLAPVRVQMQVKGDFEELRQQVQDEATAAANTLTGARYAAGRYGTPIAAEQRISLAREALVRDGYFTADQVGDDIAPRITEWFSHHRELLDEERRLSADLRARLQTTSNAASDADTKLHFHKARLIEALGMDALRDWDDIANAARGIRANRDHQRAALDAVGELHRRGEHRGQIICRECSGWDGDEHGSTDNPPVAWPCDTIKAATGYTGEAVTD